MTSHKALLSSYQVAGSHHKRLALGSVLGHFSVSCQKCSFLFAGGLSLSITSANHLNAMAAPKAEELPRKATEIAHMEHNEILVLAAHKNPCYDLAQESYKCLGQPGVVRESCQVFFDNYNACKTRWVRAKDYARRYHYDQERKAMWGK
eukprot:m.21322 g.21322  ORF g.21322 m.21322 type:complete len:149 (+) comp8058_c0_seq1:743-1189(+)